MQSRIVAGLVQEVDTNVAAHDWDVDADVQTQEEREVFRGHRDPRQEHEVYWLQDQGIQRVGLVESDSPHRWEVLWQQDNPFATFFQEPEWSTNGDTLWTEMPIQSQEQCLTHGITKAEQVRARTKKTIVLPSDLPNAKPISHVFEVQCVDEDCVIYNPPSNSRLFTQRDDGGSGPPMPVTAPASETEA